MGYGVDQPKEVLGGGLVERQESDEMTTISDHRPVDDAVVDLETICIKPDEAGMIAFDDGPEQVYQ
ncbi:uncharacterized protein ColSpa_03900 [Colletotrichum spaethianum]|uniref:Uncharacterized protein n=1 Tax=Colletotrichum spaethianum TaxID=700344 RepID=A0AA37LAG9_9PEZI|nr:uncharacterized protein ColSpa_03900 [Colletotrichum spaethianum]GKT43719.1 hypothetical protein ColSpa_03900 [Colletotrichum spaethianum]